jgi:plasmid stabilization system protein ParE
LSVTRVRYTRQAEDDLDSIGEYTLSTFGSRQYDVYMDGLEAHCRRLAETPVLGRPYRLPPYQWSRYVSHVVYFRRKDGGDIVGQGGLAHPLRLEPLFFEHLAGSRGWRESMRMRADFRVFHSGSPWPSDHP